MMDNGVDDVADLRDRVEQLENEIGHVRVHLTLAYDELSALWDIVTALREGDGE